MITWRAALAAGETSHDMRHFGYDSNGKHVAAIERKTGADTYDVRLYCDGFLQATLLLDEFEAKEWCCRKLQEVKSKKAGEHQDVVERPTRFQWHDVNPTSDPTYVIEKQLVDNSGKRLARVWRGANDACFTGQLENKHFCTSTALSGAQWWCEDQIVPMQREGIPTEKEQGLITWRAALDPDNHTLEAHQLGYDASAKHVATVDKYVHQKHYHASVLYSNGQWYTSCQITAERARMWCEMKIAANANPVQYQPPILREATEAEMGRAKGQFIPAEQVTRSPFLDADREERRKKWLHLRAQAKVWKETACRLARELAEGTPTDGEDVLALKLKLANAEKQAEHWHSMCIQQQIDTAPLRGELDALREGAKKLRDDNQKLRSELNAASAVPSCNEDVQALKGKLEESERRTKQWYEKYNEARLLENKISAYKDTMTKYEQYARGITQECQKHKADTTALRGEVDVLRDEAKKLYECLAAKDVRITELSDRALAATDNMVRLQRQLDNAKLQNMHLSEDKQVIAGELAVVKEKLTEIYRDMFGSVSGGAE